MQFGELKKRKFSVPFLPRQVQYLSNELSSIESLQRRQQNFLFRIKNHSLKPMKQIQEKKNEIKRQKQSSQKIEMQEQDLQISGFFLKNNMRRIKDKNMRKKLLEIFGYKSIQEIKVLKSKYRRVQQPCSRTLKVRGFLSLNRTLKKVSNYQNQLLRNTKGLSQQNSKEMQKKFSEILGIMNKVQ